MDWNNSSRGDGSQPNIFVSVKLEPLTNELGIGRGREGKGEVSRIGLGSQVVPFSKAGGDKIKKSSNKIKLGKTREGISVCVWWEQESV